MAGPTLEILTGDLSGRSFRVEDAEFVIGRSPSCDLVIPKRYISREHARISRAGGDYVIDGLSETNPVLVKDRPARKGTRLADGDEFEVCGIRFRFRVQGEVGGRKQKGTVVSSGSHHEEPGPDSSWAEDPTLPTQKAPRRDPGPPSGDDLPRGRRDEPSGEDDLPRGVSDDDTDAPRPRPGPRAAPSDSGDVTPPPKKAPVSPTKASVKGSSPGKVVFGEDEAEAEDEQTKELPAKKGGSVKGSTAGSAPGSGSRESGNERTAELNKVQDPNDPDYDPFAEVDRRKKKEKGVDPGREKTMRLLMILGFVGIVLAAVLVKTITDPKPLQVQLHPEEFKVAANAIFRHEEPWSKVDPPQGRVGTNRAGEPYIIHRDSVCEVEWAVPHIGTKCVFLIRGIEQGETQFMVYFPESNRQKVFKVIVEGNDPHEVARDKRREDLRTKSARELRAAAEQHLASGDAFYKEREVPSRESYHRLALLEYGLAADSALALRDVLSKTGIAPQDVTELASKCEEAEARARGEYDAFIERELAAYKDMLRRGAALKDCVNQLERVLRGLHHSCDVRFIRLRLILEECFSTRWSGEPTELCKDGQ